MKQNIKHEAVESLTMFTSERKGFVKLAQSCLHYLRSITSALRRLSPLACAVGHAAVFAVNAPLVASQRQHRAWSFRLHPPISDQHEARQAASPKYLRDEPDWEWNPAYQQFWCCVLKQLYHLFTVRKLNQGLSMTSFFSNNDFLCKELLSRKINFATLSRLLPINAYYSSP